MCGVLSACIPVCYTCSVPLKANPGCWIPWDCCYSRICSVVLGVQAGSSGKEASALSPLQP